MIVFEIHADDLETQIRFTLDYLTKQKCPQWKKAKVLESLANMLAEEMLSSGIEISINPPSIKWSDDLVTKPKPLKKGEKKGNYGICAKLIQEWSVRKTSFSVPHKKLKPSSDVVSDTSEAMQVDDDQSSQGAQALPAPPSKVVKHVGIAARETKSKINMEK